MFLWLISLDVAHYSDRFIRATGVIYKAGPDSECHVNQTPVWLTTPEQTASKARENRWLKISFAGNGGGSLLFHL